MRSNYSNGESPVDGGPVNLVSSGVLSASKLSDRHTVRSSSQTLLVTAGYGGALIVASVVVSIYVAATNGPDRQDSAGMYAFGDAILFLAIFGVAAIPATGAALFFLRRKPSFWRVASVVALAIATTGIAALIEYLVPRTYTADSYVGVWSALSPLRILLAPLCAIVFFLSGVFAPIRSCRVALLSAAVIELVVFVWVALILLHPFR